MNKIYLMVVALFCSVTTKAQTIIGDCTDLSGNCYYYVKENIIVTNSEKSKGFTFSPSVDMKNKNLVCDGIIASMVNIGGCCENNTMIMLLADSSTITLKSWNKFNCKGDAFFNLTKDEAQLLRTHKILKAQIKNGRTYDSFQNSIPTSDQDYFLRFFKELDANKYTVKK